MKKTVGIITMHRPLNFGCTLQAFASQKIIQDLGYEAQIIDYYYPEASKKQEKTIKHGILHFAYLLLAFCFTGMAFINRKKRYASFIRENLKLSRPYKKQDELINNNPKYDVYCAGSDQIWNPNFINKDYTFLMNFVPSGNKIISYASSIGINRLNEEDVRIYGEYLRRFSSISVREKQAVNVLAEQIGINAERVLDPTLLLPAQIWSKFESTKCAPQKKYILCYGATPSSFSLDKAALAISEKYGFDIVHIHGRPWKKYAKGVNYLFDVGPAEFLNLIKNASCVLTTSYHGTCFAINYGRPFYSFISKKSIDTRISDLLQLLKLEKHLLYFEQVPNDFEFENGTNNYMQLLNEEREKSISFISNALKEY